MKRFCRDEDKSISVFDQDISPVFTRFILHPDILFTGTEFIRLYTLIYDASMTHNIHTDSDCDIFKDHTLQLITDHLEYFSFHTLREYEYAWKHFERAVSHMNRVLSFINSKKPGSSLYEMGMNLWKTQKYRSWIVQEWIEELNRYREGVGTISLAPLVFSVNAMNDTEIYAYLEQCILRSIEDYYHADIDDPASFLRYVHSCLDIETRRLSSLMVSQHTIDKARQLLLKILVCDAPLHRYHTSLFHQKDKESLGLLFVLYRMTDKIETLAVDFQDHMEHVEIDRTNISNLCSHVVYGQELITQCFEGDVSCKNRMDKAMSALLDFPTAPLQMVRYIDNMLKKGDSNNHIGYLFSMLKDKDTFMAIYLRALSNRLLHHACDELSFLSILKQHQGRAYVAVASSMIFDMDISQKMSEEFSNSSFCMDMKVVSQQQWQFPKESCNTPQTLSASLSRFDAFYRLRFGQRKLLHLFQKSRAEIVIHCMHNVRALVTGHQVALLECFQCKKQITAAELEKETGVSGEYLSSALQGLVGGHVLLQTGDFYHMNMGYQCKRPRISCVSPPVIATVDVTPMRSSMIYAAIVRIMKARRFETHAALLQEVVKQVQSTFVPSVPCIKREIEHCISEEYIRRHENGYMYIS
jgi:Cullin family/Cullin protein neddylation domain